MKTVDDHNREKKLEREVRDAYWPTESLGMAAILDAILEGS